MRLTMRSGSALALGQAAALAVLAAGPAWAAAADLAITLDDLPVHGPLPPGETRLGIAQQVIAALKAAGAPPTWGFVNGVREEEEPASRDVLPAWRAAGFPLGDHTWSHMNLNDHTAAEFEADLGRNEPVLMREMRGRDWRWLRYPYLAEGATPEARAEVRRDLGARGYRIAAVTMSFGDYAFNEPYARCVAKGDQAAIARLETAYLEAAAAEALRARAMSAAAYGRDIPYVLLMHIGALDGRMAPRLLAQYRREGFRFVSLEEAERDPAYAVDLHLGAVDGPDTLEGAVRAKGLTPPPPGDLDGLKSVCA